MTLDDNDDAGVARFPVKGKDLKAACSENPMFTTLSDEYRAEFFALIEDEQVYTLVFKCIALEAPPETEAKLLELRNRVQAQLETP